MKHFRRFLPFAAAFALFATVATPAAFASGGGYDGASKQLGIDSKKATYSQDHAKWAKYSDDQENRLAITSSDHQENRLAATSFDHQENRIAVTSSDHVKHEGITSLNHDKKYVMHSDDDKEHVYGVKCEED
ncbi:hypothetical protein SAMN05444487_104232 [Marininema mesophilum]|uniref:Uncharacterized protein n=1 Tax=Marininema mesophilum TaxID=1048340 RepID=A0A1H2UW72_9BACL|nr:hypothetical protein [Marininema mesophilum]SDW59849.1 hypothetical protein SAMN05444487_104232 [Marininema mesophilum]